MSRKAKKAKNFVKDTKNFVGEAVDFVEEAKDFVDEGLEKVRSKPWAEPLGTALQVIPVTRVSDMMGAPQYVFD